MRIARIAAWLALAAGIAVTGLMFMRPMGSECTFNSSLALGGSAQSVSSSSSCRDIYVWASSDGNTLLIAAAVMLAACVLPLPWHHRGMFIPAYGLGLTVLVLGSFAGMVLPFLFLGPALIYLLGALAAFSYAAFGWLRKAKRPHEAGAR